jgi:hypothetical protein
MSGFVTAAEILSVARSRKAAAKASGNQLAALLSAKRQ